MIIIEGADNVGKSTLIRELIEEDPQLRLIRRSRYTPKTDRSIATSYINALTPFDGDRLSHSYGVMDRLLASECIYGDLFRGGCRISSGEHLAIHQMLIAYQAFIVHCDSSDESIIKSWQERDQLYNDPLPIAREYRSRIRDIFKYHRFVRYNWEHRAAPKVRKHILDTHRRLKLKIQDDLKWWTSVPYGVGSLRPKVIMIGEELSPKARTPIPFANGPAGDFLADSITQILHAVSTTYITNAVKGTNNDELILLSELSHLIRNQRTRIVLLGQIASEMYHAVLPKLPDNKQPASVVLIPHPMYWRRFQWKRRQEYVTILERAMRGMI